MRFFMSLSSCSEKTQPVCLPVTAASSSQYPTSSPLRQSVVGLSLGFSGFFSLLGLPALASYAPASPVLANYVGPNSQNSRATTAPVAPVPISSLLPESDIELATAADTVPALQDDLAFESQTAFEPETAAAANLHVIPSLSASAQAIYPQSNLAAAQGMPAFGGSQVSVEDAPRPSFTLPACKLSVGKSSDESSDVALGREKPVSEEASEIAVELMKLMSHPALTHVTSSDITQAEISLGTAVGTANLGRAQAEAEAESDAISSEESAAVGLSPQPAMLAQAPDFFAGRRRDTETSQDLAPEETSPDEELGSLRLRLQRARESEELGILRLLQTAQAAPPPPPASPVAFISGRLGFFATENVSRAPSLLDDRIMQSGITAYYFPQLSENTNLYAIAETSIARYGNFGANYTPPAPPILGSVSESIDYNQTELQLGLRQRLLPRTYAQIGWRNQRIYSTGYREKLFGINYLEAQLNHRSILNSKMWLDGFYQVRWGFALPIDSDAKESTPSTDSSRLRQTFTLSLNYSATPDLRTSLLYQLDFEDYTQMVRTDFSQQVIGIVSYNLTPESQLSVFGGTRFGRSSESAVNLDDTFYGAGLNVTVPLF